MILEELQTENIELTFNFKGQNRPVKIVKQHSTKEKPKPEYRLIFEDRPKEKSHISSLFETEIKGLFCFDFLDKGYTLSLAEKAIQEGSMAKIKHIVKSFFKKAYKRRKGCF